MHRSDESKRQCVVIKLKNSSNIKMENAVYYLDEWGNSPVSLAVIKSN